MERIPWIDRLPGVEAARSTFPAYEADDDVELRDLRVADAQATLTDVLDKPEIVDVALDRCDVVGFVARAGRAERVHVNGGRLRGVSWVDAMLQDVVLDDVAGSDVSVRFSALRRVVLRDCELPGLDCTNATFDEVQLVRCRLADAQFHGARVKSLRIEGCDLTGATGVGSLSGASIHPDDLLAIAPALAEALGMTVSL